MPDMTQKLITLSRVGANGDVAVYYPKTVAAQVFLDSAGTTLKDHTDNTNIHLSALERSRLNATGGANGYALLDGQGFVPAANINPAILAITKEYATIAALTAANATDGVAAGQLVWVNDASGDTTVDNGWAIYRKRVGQNQDYTKVNPTTTYVAASGTAEDGVTYYTDNTGATPAEVSVGDDVSSLFIAQVNEPGWTKVAEAESIDVVLQWANIQGKPNSAVADIDDAVGKRHTHNNLASVLENFVDTSTKSGDTVTKAGLEYQGEAVAFQNEVSHLALATPSTVDSVAATMAENDLIFIVSNDDYTLPATTPSDPSQNTGA